VSTILKALRRLEEEKTPQAGQRPLREEVAKPASPTAKPRRSWLLAASAGVTGVAAGALLLVLWPSVETAPPAATAPRTSSARSVPTAAPRARAAPRRPDVRAAEVPARRSPPAAPAQREAADLSPAALSSPVEVVKRPKAKPLVAEDPPPPSAPRARPAAPAVASPPPESTAPAPQPVASDNAAVAPAVAVPDAAPDTKTPASPTPATAAAASLRVEQVLWHPIAARRVAVVVVAGRDAPLRVHEGDAVGALVVAKIEPSGVVFADGAASLRLGIGESH
jgi:hypothetical protein